MTGTVPDTPALAAEAPVKRGALERLGPRAPAMLVLAVLIILLNGVTVFRVSSVSRIDERYYIDDLIKASDFSVNQSGDRLAPETLVELCERGGQAPLRFPPCTEHPNAKGFAVGGVNWLESVPTYFFLTGVPARALRALPIDLSPRDSLVTWARLLGTAWLLLGCYFTLRIGDLLGVRRRNVVLGLLLAVATPALLHASTIVNPDATAFAAGSGVLLAVLAWERRHCGLWVPLLAAFAAAAVKLPNTVGIMVALAYVAIRAVRTRLGKDDDDLRSIVDYAKVLIGVALGAVVAIKGLDAVWDQVRHHMIGKPDTDVSSAPGVVALANHYKVDSISGDDVIGATTIFSIFPPVNDIAPPEARLGGLYNTFAQAAGYLMIAALVVIPLAARRFTDRVAQLGGATLAAMLITPSLFVVYWYVFLGTNDLVVPRYGLSAMPAVVIVLAAVSSRGRIGTWLLGFAAAGMYLTALGSTFV